jgi:addiction module HigA family antidote
LEKPQYQGKAIRISCLDSNNSTVTKGIKILATVRQNLNNIVNKKSAVSLEIAIRVSKAFGGTPGTWCRTQSTYNLAQAKKKAGKLKLKATPTGGQ